MSLTKEELKNFYEKTQADRSNQQVFASGAVRSPEVAGTSKPCRYDLITPIGLRRLAETYGEGALKYGDRNWEKGIPNSNLLNHAMAHIIEYMRGDRSEDHLAHASWNLFALMHFEEIKEMPSNAPVER